MRRICGWCKREMGETCDAQRGFTHGICDDCLDLAMTPGSRDGDQAANRQAYEETTQAIVRESGWQTIEELR